VAGELKHRNPKSHAILSALLDRIARNLRHHCRLTWINKIKNGSPRAAELRDERARTPVGSGRQRVDSCQARVLTDCFSVMRTCFGASATIVSHATDQADA
jgi:hypothetical protein